MTFIKESNGNWINSLYITEILVVYINGMWSVHGRKSFKSLNDVVVFGDFKDKQEAIAKSNEIANKINSDK